MTGYTLSDIGGALSWGALSSFIHGLGMDSATAMEAEPKYAVWASRFNTNVILADIYDLLAQMNANMIAIASGKRSKKIKPYKRPFKVQHGNDETERHIGSGALPVADLEQWFKNKRAEKYGKRND